MKFLRNISAISLLILAFAACNKPDDYNDIPEIFDGSYTTYKDATGKDTALVLKFSFTDGDGNVGLRDGDTVPPHHRNLYIDYFEKQNGQFTKVTGPSGDTIYLNQRIKRFGTSNPTKAVVEVLVQIGFTLADTIKLDYYIEDRDYNKSNKLTTGPIIVNQQ